MTTHQLATLLDHLRNGFGDNLKAGAGNEFADLSAAFRELPDQSLKEVIKQLRKIAAPVAKTVVDVPALIAHIRFVCESPAATEPVHIELEGLNNTQLKDILKAFAVKPTTTVAGNLTKVRQLIRPGVASDSNVSPVAQVLPDPQAVECGVRLYNSLLADRKLSISDVRAGFEPLRAYPKAVIEEISRHLGYTPVGSQTDILNRLLTNLEGIKLSQHRADRILVSTGS
jgi:hypothetical protein